MSANSGSDEPIVDGMVMVTSADRETTVLLPVMVVWRLRVSTVYRVGGSGWWGAYIPAQYADFHPSLLQHFLLAALNTQCLPSSLLQYS